MCGSAMGLHKTHRGRECADLPGGSFRFSLHIFRTFIWQR